VVDPHDKTVLARDLQIPDEPQDDSIFDAEIVVPDLGASTAPGDRASDPGLEQLSIPELERISIPALLPAESAPKSVPRMPPQAAVPGQREAIPSLPASSQRTPVRPGSGQRAAVAAQPSTEALGGRAAQSRPRSVVGEPVEFDEDFEDFQAGGLSNVQAQLLETVQTQQEEPELPWPTGNSPEYSSIVIDPLDAQVHANYGKAPTSPLRTPEYAIKVFKRRLELKKELAEAKLQVVAAETHRDGCLASLTQACRGLEGSERYKHFFANFEQLEKVAQERQQALAGDNEQYAAETAKADQLLAEHQKRGAAIEAELAKLSQKLAETHQLLTRAEAQYRRLLIEIRSLKNAEEEARTQNKTVNHGPRIAELMGHVQGHQAAVAKRTADRAAAAALVEGTRKELQRFAEEDRRLKKQRDDLEKSFQQRLGLRSQGVAQTQQEITNEAAQTARALLSQRGVISIPEMYLAAVRTADEDVLRQMKHQRLLEVALTIYDRDTFAQGRNFIIGSVVVVLLVIAMKWFDSSSRTDEDSGGTEETRATTSETWRVA
jgi:hypothetical protein